MTGEPSFFEIGVEDAAKGRKFYGALFGWEIEEYRSGGLLRTAGIPGGLHGSDVTPAPYLFFRVDDLDAAMARVEELGGVVERSPGATAEPTPQGRFVFCKDDQGSGFGLHEPPAAS